MLYDQDFSAYDRYYWDYRSAHSETSWYSIAGPSDGEVGRLILFLNQWATHYGNQPLDRANLAAAVLKTTLLRQALKFLDIVEVDFQAQILPGKTVGEIAKEVFATVMSARGRQDATGASKILHMLNPDFFIMWDEAIRRGYAVEATPNDYAFRFLPLMQMKLRKVVGSYISDNQTPPSLAVSNLRSLRAHRSLPKMIDEFNYEKFTARRLELWGL